MNVESCTSSTALHFLAGPAEPRTIVLRNHLAVSSSAHLEVAVRHLKSYHMHLCGFALAFFSLQSSGISHIFLLRPVLAALSMIRNIFFPDPGMSYGADNCGLSTLMEELRNLAYNASCRRPFPEWLYGQVSIKAIIVGSALMAQSRFSIASASSSIGCSMWHNIPVF